MTKIIETEMIPVQESLYCECGEIMKATILLPTSPPQYEYICSKCNIKFISDIQYPRIKFIPVNDVEAPNAEG